jgi:hypothetical protein
MATTEETRIRKKLARITGQQQEVLKKLQPLVINPDASPAQLIRREQARLTAEQERLFTDLELAQLSSQTDRNGYVSRDKHFSTSTFGGRQSMREQVLNVLEEIGVPAAPRTVSDFAACFGLSLSASRFSSLRRDERRAYQKDPLSRPAWVVPAINAVGLTAIPRLVCSSAWEDEQRVVGSRTLHVNHLRTLLSLLVAAERAPHLGDANAERVRGLVTRYATTIPGALEFGGEPNYERIEAAVKSELERIEAPDAEERQTAAKKMAQSAAFHRLWGRPTVIEGDVGRGAS